MSAGISAPFERALKIRPHHGLCTAFFVGEGYSGDFVKNMSRVVSFLSENDPVIILTEGADMICENCPNLADGVCSGEKAGKYDLSVLSVCGISFGTEMRSREFSALVHEKIISAGRLGEICGDCRWYGICGGKPTETDV